MTKWFRVFESSGNKLTEAKTPREAIHDAFSSRPPPTPAPSRAGCHRATSLKALPGSTHYSKAEYTNTQQVLPVGDNYFTKSRP
jgi:hypothetical protein